jgi:exonuclease SbcC
VRPLRLELEGFSAYRAPTVVDFDGVDLFALAGPTGAGKTAVLDAIAFALYGVIHRLGDRRAVEPAISQGLVEARVRLDFAVGDERWTAARVVRRTKRGGATTPEARLEGPAGVVAGTADEVTAAVTDLLGLSYEHFSRCVVLPQGEFARFLHDRPADRQELLVSLLDLSLYGRMANAAGRRAGDAKVDAARLEGRLDELEGVTEEAIAAAAARVEALAALVAAVDAELPAVVALDDEEAAARARAQALTDEAARLAAVAVPGDVAGVATAARDAAAAVAEAEAACERADADAEAAAAAVAALPERGELAALLEAFDEHTALVERRANGERVVAARRADAEAAGKALAVADDELDAARRSADRVAAAHRAHAVRADVAVGAPCPVCAQVVVALPDEPPPADLAASHDAVTAAERARAGAAAAVAGADRELTKALTLLEQVTERAAALEGRLAGRERAGVEADLAAVTAAVTAAAAATDAAKVARRREKAARESAAAAQRALAAAREQFDRARDAVADLGVPARLGTGDLAAEWSALAAWAGEEAPGRRAEAQDATAAATGIAERRSAALAALSARCAAAGVEVRRGEQPRDAAAAAHARALAEHGSLQQRLADAEAVRAELAAVTERRDVAKALATHLDAAHFERWLLDEAVEGLAEGATELLRTLSGGQYSLAVDARKGFVVVDHHNADETRAARTLSGGETFLASLALALALADRTASLAAGGPDHRGLGRLDAIFLDEGFGTLDPDTLDVVATAIEELGAAGRMVGVVSHVAELAERMPVRYEVHRAGSSSTITRVDR